MKQCFIYQISSYNQNIKNHIDKIYGDIKDSNIDFYVLYNIHHNNKVNVDSFYYLKDDYQSNPDIRIEAFTIEDITKNTIYYNNPYICVWNCSDFAFDYIYSLPMLWFYKRHNEYDYYWRLEQDIIYNGDYLELIGGFTDNNTDLLCSHLYNITGFNKRKYYLFICNKRNLPNDIKEYYKCLVNVCRISNKGIQEINKITLDKKWYGYDEFLLPTFFKYDNLTVHDFNEFGEYYTIGEQDEHHHVYHNNDNELYYSSLSMFYYNQNILNVSLFKNKLIHKCDWMK